MNKSIFEFYDYKAYLKHFISQLPKNGRGEIGRIAKALNVNSTLISQIMMGLKDFTVEQAADLADYLGLKELESDYFILLIQKERAGTKKLKDRFQKKLNFLKDQSLEVSKRIEQDKVLTDTERAVFYSSYVYSAIRLFCSIENGKTADEIATRFLLPRNKVTEIMQFLVETRLCEVVNGIYKMGPQRTHIEQSSPFVSRIHSNWRVKAIQRSENLEKTELMFTAPISISRKDFESLREDFITTIQKLSDKVKNSEAEDIACINLDLFWIKN